MGYRGKDMVTDFDPDDNEFDPFWITGKALDRHFELEAAILEFSRLFRHASDDRAMVIVGGAFLETLLEHILIAFLINDEREVGELLRYDQPLGTYGGRVRAAYCFGLIPKVVRTDLSLVGKVRNRFAHDLYASFEDSNISSWCVGLQFHRRAFMSPPADASPRDLFYVGLTAVPVHDPPQDHRSAVAINPTRDVQEAIAHWATWLIDRLDRLTRFQEFVSFHSHVRRNRMRRIRVIYGHHELRFSVTPGFLHFGLVVM